MAIAPEAIHALVIGVPGVLNCHSIASRGLLGRQVLIEMHLVADTSDVKSAHPITDAVEDPLAECFPPVRLNIHVESPAYQSDQISYGPSIR